MELQSCSETGCIENQAQLVEKCADYGDGNCGKKANMAMIFNMSSDLQQSAHCSI